MIIVFEFDRLFFAVGVLGEGLGDFDGVADGLFDDFAEFGGVGGFEDDGGSVLVFGVLLAEGFEAEEADGAMWI